MNFEENVWYKFKDEFNAGEWIERTISNREICRVFRKLMPNNPKLNDAEFMASLRFRPSELHGGRVLAMHVRKNENSEAQSRLVSLYNLRTNFSNNNIISHLSAIFNKQERQYFKVEFDGRTKQQKEKIDPKKARGLEMLVKRGKEIQARLKELDDERNRLYIEFDKIKDEVLEAKTRTLNEINSVFGE